MTNTIHAVDTIEGMRRISDESVDLILCDFPFGITQNKWDEIIDMDDLWTEYARIIKPRGVIALTATFLFGSKLIEAAKVPFRYDLVWEKNKTTGFLNANRQPLRKHENILVFYKQAPKYNPQKTTGDKPVNIFTKRSSDGSNYGETKMGISGGGQTDRHPTSILSFNVVNNDSKERINPTQKPVELFEWLIRSYRRTASARQLHWKWHNSSGVYQE